MSPLKARPEALQQLDQASPESRPVADLTTRLSRFAPFEAAIGFRDRRLRSRCVTSFLCRVFLTAVMALAFCKLLTAALRPGSVKSSWRVLSEQE